MQVGAIGGYSYPVYMGQQAAPIPSNNPASGAKGAATVSINNSKVNKNDPNYECQTCENRRYQDGSNENNVSFKSASKVAPEAAASAVRSHEQQHVSNAYNKAELGNGKVVSATVSIHTSVCPECGKTYVSGGTTRTQIRYRNEDNPYQKNLKALQGNALRGANVNIEA